MINDLVFIAIYYYIAKAAFFLLYTKNKKFYIFILLTIQIQ